MNFIWDLDGTLVDSYDAILDSIKVAYDEAGLDYDREVIREFILRESVHALFDKVADEKGILLRESYARDWENSNHKIHLMDGAREILAWTKERGIQNFIYTHKGANAHSLLEDLDISTYFVEVVTNANGFRRKPHPEGADYLMDKYGLERSETYYIGDRTLDVDLAMNSGIHSINFCDYQLDQSQQIQKLTDIQKLF